MCPHCNSDRLWKAGQRYSQYLRQNYYCRDCHRHTVNPVVIKDAEATLANKITSAGQEHDNVLQ